MSSSILFRGQSLNHSETEVVVVTAAGERPLTPPPGARFAWGSMGEHVSVLATAIATELYPEPERASAASLIKRHFLIAIKRNDPWQLTGAEIQAYVDTRRGPAAAPAEGRVSA